MGGPGFFVAFEGGEGAGKSTQVRRLALSLAAAGRDVVTTREPGGTPAGVSIRSIVLDPATGHLTPRAEALLYAADRAHHVAIVVRPALERGAVVLTDRYVDSSLAYQGAGRTLDVGEVKSLSAWATDGLVPDLTVLLDLDPVDGLKRAGDPDRLEAEPLEFHQRVRALFLALAAAEPDRYAVIDAARSPEEVFAGVSLAVGTALGGGVGGER
jgi:dTMP kinase